MQKVVSEQKGKIKFLEDEILRYIYLLIKRLIFSLNDDIEISKRATVERSTECNQLKVLLTEFDAKYVTLEQVLLLIVEPELI